MAKKKSARSEIAITDRESLRRFLVASDDNLLTGFLSARLLSSQDKTALESMIGVLQDAQDVTVNAFLDLLLAKYQATS